MSDELAVKLSLDITDEELERIVRDEIELAMERAAGRVAQKGEIEL